MAAVTRVGWLFVSLILASYAAAQSDDYLEASKLYQAGQYAPALQRVESLLAGRPKDARARLLQGRILADQGKPTEAIPVLSALTADYPELPEPHSRLGMLYASQGLYDEARAELELAIRLQPGDAAAQESLGDVYARLAIREYGVVQQLDKSNAAAETKLRLLQERLLNSRQPRTAAQPSPAESAPAPVPRVVAPPVAGARVPAGLAARAASGLATDSGVGAAEQGARTTYRVKRGDTLATIAASTKPPEASLEQMMVGLYRSNPGAFGGNMDRPKVGAILRFPPLPQIIAMSVDDAIKEVGNYRQRLATAAGSAPEPASGARGGITATAREKTATAEPPRNAVMVSKGVSSSGAAPGVAGQPLGYSDRAKALEDEMTARAQALRDASARIAQLEKTLAQAQQLLQSKGQAAGGTAVGGERAAGKAEAARPQPTMARAADQMLDHSGYLVMIGVLVIFGAIRYWAVRHRLPAAPDAAYGRHDPVFRAAEAQSPPPSGPHA